MATTVPTLRPSLRRKAPGLAHERECWDAGLPCVAGVDEVGRGAWAGPLTLGVVVLPHDRRINKVRDSKLLSEAEREAMFDRIVDWVDDYGVGHAWPHECDELGMSEAQRLAARRALEALATPPDMVLLDGNWNFIDPGLRSKTIVKGDRTCLSIAAASIIAKVTRDRIMRNAAGEYPWFSFETNKGYPCPRHKTALAGVGPSAIHRRSWVFMESLPWPGAERVLPRHVRDQGTLF